MKWVITTVVALLLAAPVQSGEHKFGVGYSKLDREFTYDNSEVRVYEMKAVEIKYSYWVDNVGFGISLSRSGTGSNTHIHGQQYEMSIPLMWRAQVMYKYDFNNISCYGGVGLTEYKAVTLVDGAMPSWSGNSDSYKPSVSGGCSYNFKNGFGLELSYGLDNYSKKDTKDEVTTHTSLTLIKRF